MAYEPTSEDRRRELESVRNAAFRAYASGANAHDIHAYASLGVEEAYQFEQRARQRDERVA